MNVLASAPGFVAVDAATPDLYVVQTHAPGPAGHLPLDDEYLRHAPSGHIFGLTQDAGMGWNPALLLRKEFLILSTQGGIRAADGSPVALGYHTGHWEVGLLMQAAAEEFGRLGAIPFAGFVTDPCDGRTQGTPGMMDSLPYRNDAAIVLRRLMRSLPTRAGVMGVATCDKGLPAMLLALAGQCDLPSILVPGGVTLPPSEGEDAGKVQTLGVRFAQGEITLEEAAELGCRACGSPGGGCQFLGTAATSQVVAEALGLSLFHAALTPSGQPIWLDMARRSAQALAALEAAGLTTNDILTEDALHNAMVVHAAFGGSTNLLLHIPAIAHAAGLRIPTVAEWSRINAVVPRLVDVLPNGPVGHPTVRVFLAGGVPEVMLNLRDLGLLRLDALTAHGRPLGEMLDIWQASARRRMLRAHLLKTDGIDPRRRDHGAGAGAAARADQHCHLSTGQPGAGGVGRQEHVHRPARARCRRRLSQGGAGARLYERSGRHRCCQRADRRTHPPRRHHRADGTWAVGLRHGGDLPDYLGAEASAVGQGSGAGHRCAL